MQPQIPAVPKVPDTSVDPLIKVFITVSLCMVLHWPQEFTYLVAQLVKNPPAIQETWVWSLGWEDPLERGKATHSSILAWRIPGHKE